MKHYAVLFVCMGNICRSPTAEGVFLHKVQQHDLQDVVTVDSAGTHNYHPNSPPDPRSQERAALRGYDLSALRARKIKTSDFDAFDLILAMDWVGTQAIQRIAALYKIEREIKCFSVEGRHAARQSSSKPLCKDLHEWLKLERLRVPDGSTTAKAIAYSLNRWDALTVYLDNGAVQIDNNVTGRESPSCGGRPSLASSAACNQSPTF